MSQDDRPSPAALDQVSDQALAWIMKLHSGHATTADHRAYRAWRALSVENDAAAREAEELWSEASDIHVDAITGIARPGRRAVLPARRGMVAAAAAVLATGPIATYWALDKQAGDLRSKLGEIRTIALPDGSRVTLNARSAITLRFSWRERGVELLEGEAFFEVVPDRKRPFRVATQTATITAIGTAFNVNRNLSQSSVSVSVEEHAVIVASGTRASESVHVEENRVVVVDSNGRIGPAKSVSARAATAWRRGTYVAQDTTLADVVAALQSYHPGWIVLRGAGTAGLRVNAVLDLREPDDALDALATGLPIAIHRITPYLVILSG